MIDREISLNICAFVAKRQNLHKFIIEIVQFTIKQINNINGDKMNHSIYHYLDY